MRDPSVPPDACPFPAPELDPFSAQVLYVFLLCQTQWNYAGMGGRTGIYYVNVKIAAGGIELTEPFLEKFNACVWTVLEHDGAVAKALSEQREQNKQNPQGPGVN